MLGHMQECERLIKCGSNAMLLVDTEKQVIYPQVFNYYVGHSYQFYSLILRQACGHRD